MRNVGSLSGKVQRELKFLKKLNDSLLKLEINALGKNSDLDITPKDVEDSQKFIKDFAERLISVLKQESTSMDLLPIFNHFLSGMKPIEDWIEDLELLLSQIKDNKINQDSIIILEDILSLLDEEFTEDIRRLYF